MYFFANLSTRQAQDTSRENCNTKQETVMKSYVYLVLASLITLTAPVSAQESSATHDWSGVYGGLTYGSTGGEVTETIPVPIIPDQVNNTSTQNSFGLFAGYNWQRDKIVFGGEFVYLNEELPLDGNPDSIQDDIFELRGRVGYALNKFHIYGLVGYSASNYKVRIGAPFKLAGPTLGLGVEYAVTDSIFVGFEATNRKIEGQSSANITTIYHDLTSFQFRVGYAF